MHTIGSDFGFGNMKTCDRYGASTYASHVSVVSGTRFVDSVNGGQRAALVEFDQGRFYTGPYAAYEGVSVGNLGMDRLVGSLEIRALFYSSLSAHFTAYSRPRQPLALYVGLPFTLLRQSDAASIQSAMNAWLLGDHTWRFNGEDWRISIGQVVLKPQAAGALFDHILNLDGTPGPQAGVLKGEVGVISVGYNTIELMVLSGGKQVDRMAGSEMLGVRRLLELLNTSNLYTLTELDTLLRDNRLNGDSSQAIGAWGEMTQSYISTTWSNTWKRFGRVIVVGGGAVMLQAQIEKYFQGRAVVPIDPIQSVARGLYKRGVADGKRKG